MLNKINKKICFLDYCIIISSTFFKVLRGCFIKPMLKKSKGLLFVGKRCLITHKKSISVGRNVKFEAHSEIHGLSKKGYIFGDSVTIGNSAMIRSSSYYGVELGEGFKIGSNSSIGPLSYIGCGGYVEIGENVMLGPRVSLFAENHEFSSVDTTIKSQGITRKGIKIEDNCWIGSGVIILDGVTIGKGSIVGAGTLVTKSLPPYSKVFDKRNKSLTDRSK